MKPILYMAPITGITNSIYRNVYSGLFDGYDRCITPFVRGSAVRKSTFRDVLPEKNDTGFELIPQILSKDPKSFISLSNGIFELGYKTVNWNLGCPLPMVRKKKRGSGLLPFASEIVKFLEEVIPRIHGPISLKVRLGCDDKEDLFKLLPLLNDLPLEEIIIHPRTGKQMYEGEADIPSFEESLSLTTHTVVYSGDIDSVGKFKALSKRFPAVNRWMIGRGGIVDPFLPEEIKGLTHNTDREKLNRFEKFHQEIFQAYRDTLSGPAHLIGKMKENWRYWVKAYENGEHLFLEIATARTIDKYRKSVENFFKEKPKLLKARTL